MAVLAGTQFDAEHESTVVLENSAFMMVEADIERYVMFLTVQAPLKIVCREIVLNERQQNAIRIPRRPDWDSFMTADELDKREREAFLQWRRDIAKEEEQEVLLVTEMAPPLLKRSCIWMWFRRWSRSHQVFDTILF